MYAYHLENGIKIPVERLADIVASTDPWPQYYIDTKTAMLIELASLEMLKVWVDEIGNTTRYYNVEQFTEADVTLYARDFIDDIIDIVNSKLAVKARKILVQDGLEAFEDLLDDDEGWIHGWVQYRYDAAYEAVESWLQSMPGVPVTKKFEGCDNCEICKLMKEEKNPSLEKLSQAFAIENTMQTVEAQLADGAPAIIKPPVLVETNKNVKPKKIKSDIKVVCPATVLTAEGVEIPTEEAVMVFKVSLNNSNPLVWRRITVPANYTFFELHCAIIDAMGWVGYHLFAFYIGNNRPSKSLGEAVSKGAIPKQICIGWPTEDDWSMVDEANLDICTEYIATWWPGRIKQCQYTYDFGDNWDHTVMLEKIVKKEAGVIYPQCLAGKNACPPEDCGGVWGYLELLKILKNPKHREYREQMEWLGFEPGDKFDPTQFSPAEVEFSDPQEILAEMKHIGM